MLEIEHQRMIRSQSHLPDAERATPRQSCATPELLCPPRRSPKRNRCRSSLSSPESQAQLPSFILAPKHRRPPHFAISGAPGQRLRRSALQATTMPRPPPGSAPVTYARQSHRCRTVLHRSPFVNRPASQIQPIILFQI
jgi:hypothetical protein